MSETSPPNSKDNPMSIDRDDPRLTAYALGELPEKEAAEVEAVIEKDPALKAEVESIRQVAEKLKTTLAAEPLPGNESKPESKPVQPVKTENKRRGRRWALAGGSVVAVVLVFVVFVLPAMQRAREAARQAHLVDSATSWGYPDMPASDDTGSEPPSAEAPQAEEPFEAAADSDGSMAGVAPGYSANGPARGKQMPGMRMGGMGMEGGMGAGMGSAPAGGTMGPGMGMMGMGGGGGVRSGQLPTSFYMTDDIQYVPDGEQPSPNPSIRRPDGRFNTETYDKIVENEFKRVSEHPLSTFSIDVDTTSYSMVRSMLTTEGRMPPPGAVRLEELINYFDYAYEPPTDEKPFATHVDAAKCPWNDKHNLVRIGLKGKIIAKEQRDPANLVFLLDVSGSMNQPNKLPLLKTAMTRLVENLNEQDRVAIAVYAGAAGLVLPSTPCSDKQKIIDALARLNAGGSTNGGAGIQLAYATAAANFIEGGVNRVILCTDGDFNIGMTNQSELISMIEKKAKDNIFLTVLGFGMGNYKDSTLEKLADKGNGNYGYIDTEGEADKLLVEGLSGTLVTIAKDVKIQVEFNPHHVKAYRLLGYENRMLKKEDFNDDTKDAGEIGAGHTVTALYELIPADSEEEVAAPKVDELKYQKDVEKTDAARSDELLTVKLRYKEPDGDTSKLLSFPVKNEIVEFDAANVDLKFASAVAAFGMLLRDSQFKGTANYEQVLGWAKSSLGEDEFNYREEFLGLIRAAQSLGNR